MSVVACIQMASGPNVGANLLEAERLIEEAVSQQARLVVLPENFALMGKTESFSKSQLSRAYQRLRPMLDVGKEGLNDLIHYLRTL